MSLRDLADPGLRNRDAMPLRRLLFVGLLLIVLMIYRPHGLLGQRRVEVV